MLNNLRKTLHVSASFTKRCFCVKRKYPINPEEAKTLPVFDYGVSKESYRRVYVWGNLLTGALGVPYLKKNANILKREYLPAPKRLGFAEKFPIATAACGFGFTAFAINTENEVKVYGTGLNTDSQIGYHEIRKGHPLEILYFPQPIHIPFRNTKKTRIKKLAAGRAHLAVLCDEGLFLLGNNSYGQCARDIIEDENYMLSNYINHIPKIDSKRIIDIECGQDHTFAITEDNSVYSCGWGADGQTGLGHFKTTSEFIKVKGDIEDEKIVKIASKSDCVLALNDKGEAFAWGNTEYAQIHTNQQQVCHPIYLKNLQKLGKITDVAAGGSFCMALNENGEIFVWGYGILGAGPKVEQSPHPIKLPETLFGRNDFQPNNKVVKVTCGLSYAMAVTSLGDVFAWGRNLRCCLGLGSENNQYFPLKVSLGGYTQDIFCGVDHTVAICKPFI